MSVCIIAQYPWRAAEPFTAGEPAGVIVCNDTRVTVGQRTIEVIFPKQFKLARNMAVCYTSSNLYATTQAFAQSFHSHDLRKVGRALYKAHKVFGGTTELLGVVSRRGRIPQVLELMAPKYEPLPRSGILGIGDSGALDWFKGNFNPIYPPPTPALSTAAMESLQRAAGRPLEFLPSRFRISDAAVQVAGALHESIIRGGGHTVGLPIEVLTFTADGIFRGRVATLPDGGVWTTITADPSALRIPPMSPCKIQVDRSHRTARQLFP